MSNRPVRRGLILVGMALAALMGGGLPAEAAKKQTFVYLHDNRNTNPVIHGYRLDKDGKLAAIPGTPFATGSEGSGGSGMLQSLAYSPRRQMLFSSSKQGLNAHQVAVDGTLTAVPGSPFGGTTLNSAAVVELGNRTFVYGSDFDNDQVYGFEVQGNGSLVAVPGSPYAAGDGPSGLSAAKDVLVVANENSTEISAYRVQSNGALAPAPGSPFPVLGAGFIYNVFIEPTAKFVYLADADYPSASGAVFAFAVNKTTAGLTPVTGYPVTSNLITSVGLALSKSMLVTPSGISDRMRSYRREKNGAIRALSGTIETEIGVIEGVAFEPRGKFLLSYAANTDRLMSIFVLPNGSMGLADQKTVNLSTDDVNGVAVIQR